LLHSVSSDLGLDALKRISNLPVPNKRRINNKIITAPKLGERSSRLEFHTSTNDSNGKNSRQKKTKAKANRYKALEAYRVVKMSRVAHCLHNRLTDGC
jgi:hypothetical protein